MLARAADHVGFAVFCAVLGVILGAATIGPFEVVTVLPSLVGAVALVLMVFPVLRALAGSGRGFRIDVQVRGREAAAQLHRGDVGEDDGQDVPEGNGRR